MALRLPADRHRPDHGRRAHAAAQAPSPTTQTRTAVTRLVTDTNALTDAQAPAAPRNAVAVAPDAHRRS